MSEEKNNREFLRRIFGDIKLNKFNLNIFNNFFNRNPFLEILTVLLITLGFFTIFSFLVTPTEEKFITKPSGIAAFLKYSPQKKKKNSLEEKNKNQNLPPEKKKNKIKIDTSYQKILLTGDSMSEGLLFPFMDTCKKYKHKFVCIPVYSSTTMSFANSNKMKELVNKYNPTYVILTLGSNELFIRGIEKRDEFVKKIISQVGDRKLIWIGPPNWKDDTGINDLIIKNMGKGKFFDSRNIKLERARDGAHPTFKAARVWADTIFRWLMNTDQCKYPIRIGESKTSIDINNRVIQNRENSKFPVRKSPIDRPAKRKRLSKE